MPWKRSRTVLFLFFLLAAVLLASCSVSQTLVIKSDGSGSLSMRVEITKVMHDYISSLAEVVGKDDVLSSGKIFDVAEIQKGFESQPGVTIKRIATPTPDVLEADVAYASIQKVLLGGDALKAGGVFSYTEAAGKKTLKIHLDKRNFSQLSTLFPLLSNPMFEGMGPQADQAVTESEYLDMIGFSLGDQGPAALKKSYIDLTVKPEGEILSQTGGTKSSSAVLFRIPLLRILVLDKPLDYSLSWR